MKTVAKHSGTVTCLNGTRRVDPGDNFDHGWGQLRAVL